MALTKCQECTAQISTTAQTCPHCGFSKPKRKPLGCGTLILALIFCGILGAALDPEKNGKNKEPAMTSEQIRAEQIKKMFSWDGSNFYVEKYLKANLKDPDSYEHIETRYSDQGQYVQIYSKYRAKNSFGGCVVNSVSAKVTTEGKIITIKTGE